MSPQRDAGDGTVTLRLALFASLLSALIAAAMLVLRTGLPTPLGVVSLGPAITALATLGPALTSIFWADRRAFRSQLWLGPIVALTLLAACLIAALGLVGHVLIWIAGLAALIRSIIALRQTGAAPSDARTGRRLAFWALLLATALALAVLLIDGSKYLNFIADQLLLYGRTDGDVMFHGAITNAIRYFGFPSTGVDGLHLLRYHTGVDALAALIAGGSGTDATLALMVLQSLVLVPLAVFGLGWGATVFARLLPDPAPGALRLAGGAVIVGLLMQSGWLANLVYLNPPMLMSGVLLILLAPPVVIDLIDRREQAKLALLVAIVALPVISLSKISSGLIWGALTGYLVLRQIGPKRPAFWAVGAVMLALFAGCFWLANDPGQAGAVLFGTPFYAAQGFDLAAILTPLTVHILVLIAVIGLAGLRSGAEPPRRRLLIEALLAVAVAANLPGLVLEIPGGDAFFFLSAMNWIAAPFVVMLIAALPAGLREAKAWKRRTVLALVGVAVLESLVNGGLRTDDRIYTAISGTALLHTGDLAYYSDDKRRVWKADTRRALDEHGLVGLYRLKPPPPAGAGLALALAEAKQQDGLAAAYIPPQSDYWAFVKDCDGRSLWPMAVAGVPLIDGYVPAQAECRQEFALIGYPAPPETRTPLAESELCRRAIAAGLPAVLQIESLQDRSRDRRIACR